MAMIDMYGVEKLLFELRKHKDLAVRFREDADAVMDGYELDEDQRRMLREGDYHGILNAGANPYLLYFFALQVGVGRAAYYANVRGEEA